MPDSGVRRGRRAPCWWPKVKLHFTPSGRIQCLKALSYIHQDNPQAAVNFRNSAERILRRLMLYAKSGRLIPEFPDLPFREVMVAPYRFFYRREGNAIWVVACLHGARLPAEPVEGMDV
jgi:toxin ParE1/3/4